MNYSREGRVHIAMGLWSPVVANGPESRGNNRFAKAGGVVVLTSQTPVRYTARPVLYPTTLRLSGRGVSFGVRYEPRDTSRAGRVVILTSRTPVRYAAQPVLYPIVLCLSGRGVSFRVIYKPRDTSRAGGVVILTSRTPVRYAAQPVLYPIVLRLSGRGVSFRVIYKPRDTSRAGGVVILTSRTSAHYAAQPVLYPTVLRLSGRGVSFGVTYKPRDISGVVILSLEHRIGVRFRRKVFPLSVRLEGHGNHALGVAAMAQGAFRVSGSDSGVLWQVFYKNLAAGRVKFSLYKTIRATFYRATQDPLIRLLGESFLSKLDFERENPNLPVLRYEGDPSLFLSENGADICFVNGNPIMDQALENHVLISLFTRPGWAGNMFLPEDQKIGSRVEALAKGAVTRSSLDELRMEAERALSSSLIQAAVKVTNPVGSQIYIETTLSPVGGEETRLSSVRSDSGWHFQRSHPAHKKRRKK